MRKFIIGATMATSFFAFSQTIASEWTSSRDYSSLEINSILSDQTLDPVDVLIGTSKDRSELDEKFSWLVENYGFFLPQAHAEIIATRNKENNEIEYNLVAINVKNRRTALALCDVMGMGRCNTKKTKSVPRKKHIAIEAAEQDEAGKNRLTTTLVPKDKPEEPARKKEIVPSFNEKAVENEQDKDLPSLVTIDKISKGDIEETETKDTANLNLEKLFSEYQDIQIDMVKNERDTKSVRLSGGDREGVSNLSIKESDVLYHSTDAGLITIYTNSANRFDIDRIKKTRPLAFEWKIDQGSDEKGNYIVFRTKDGFSLKEKRWREYLVFEAKKEDAPDQRLRTEVATESPENPVVIDDTMPIHVSTAGENTSADTENAATKEAAMINPVEASEEVEFRGGDNNMRSRIVVNVDKIKSHEIKDNIASVLIDVDQGYDLSRVIKTRPLGFEWDIPVEEKPEGIWLNFIVKENHPFLIKQWKDRFIIEVALDGSFTEGELSSPKIIKHSQFVKDDQTANAIKQEPSEVTIADKDIPHVLDTEKENKDASINQLMTDLDEKDASEQKDDGVAGIAEDQAPEKDEHKVVEVIKPDPVVVKSGMIGSRQRIFVREDDVLTEPLQQNRTVTLKIDATRSVDWSEINDNVFDGISFDTVYDDKINEKIIVFSVDNGMNIKVSKRFGEYVIDFDGYGVVTKNDKEENIVEASENDFPVKQSDIEGKITPEFADSAKEDIKTERYKDTELATIDTSEVGIAIKAKEHESIKTPQIDKDKSENSVDAFSHKETLAEHVSPATNEADKGIVSAETDKKKDDNKIKSADTEQEVKAAEKKQITSSEVAIETSDRITAPAKEIPEKLAITDSVPKAKEDRISVKSEEHLKDSIAEASDIDLDQLQNTDTPDEKKKKTPQERFMESDLNFTDYFKSVILPVSPEYNGPYVKSSKKIDSASVKLKEKSAERKNWDKAIRVEAGDTLISIARRYNIDFEILAEVNGIKAPEYIIKKGQKIRMPNNAEAKKVVSQIAENDKITSEEEKRARDILNSIDVVDKDMLEKEIKPEISFRPETAPVQQRLSKPVTKKFNNGFQPGSIKAEKKKDKKTRALVLDFGVTFSELDAKIEINNLRLIIPADIQRNLQIFAKPESANGHKIWSIMGWSNNLDFMKTACDRIKSDKNVSCVIRAF